MHYELHRTGNEIFWVSKVDSKDSNLEQAELRREVDELVKQGASAHWPLAWCYQAAGFVIDGECHDKVRLNANSQGVRDHQGLSEKLKQCGPLPFEGTSKRKISSTMGIFTDYINRHCDYYIAQDDIANIKANNHAIAEMLDGANLLELASGRCIKTIFLLKEAANLRLWPDNIYLNDIVSQNYEDGKKNVTKAWEECAQQLVGKKFDPDHNIHPLSCDIMDFKNEQLLLTLEMLRNSDRPTVVLFLGATFNDFSLAQLTEFFIFLKAQLKPGSICLFSIDGETDKARLQKAYDHAAMKQFFLMTWANAMWERDITVNFGALEVEIKVQEPVGKRLDEGADNDLSAPGVDPRCAIVRGVINIAEDCVVPKKYPQVSAEDGILSAGRYESEFICKFPDEVIHELCASTGWKQVIEPMHSPNAKGNCKLWALTPEAV